MCSGVIAVHGIGGTIAWLLDSPCVVSERLIIILLVASYIFFYRKTLFFEYCRCNRSCVQVCDYASAAVASRPNRDETVRYSGRPRRMVYTTAPSAGREILLVFCRPVRAAV